MLYDNQPYTQAELMAITGLSKDMVCKTSKILEKSNVFKTTRAYESYSICLGKNVDLNGFYKGNFRHDLDSTPSNK